MITENLSTLKIHKLTQEQYDRELEAGRIDHNALYLTPDEENSNIYIQNEEPVDVEDGSLWVDLDAEGTVGGANTGGGSVNIDTTLTKSGQAADAKAVGDALATKQPLGDYLTEVPDGYAKSEDIPTKTSELTNDSGFMTSYTETDPTVPSWAKASTKPTYTASEVGALPDTTVIPTVPETLPNPHALTINGITYDGSEEVNMTDVVNSLIDAKLSSITNAEEVAF